METTDRSDLFMRNIPKKMATSHLQLCLVSFDFHVLVCVCVCVCECAIANFLLSVYDYRRQHQQIYKTKQVYDK